MKTTRKIVPIAALIFSVTVTVASIYMLHHAREEAYHQASLDMERRLKTFWELVHTKGDEFRLQHGKLLVGDYLINGNFELPDKVKDIFGGTATVFMGDIRVSTNVPRDDGSRAVGTRLVGPAYDAIFKQGTAYRGEADILGKKYFTAYDPIRSSEGKVIGALYVGVEKGAFLNHYDHLIIGFLGPVGFLVVVSIGLYLLLMKEGAVAERQQERSLHFLQELIDALPTPIFYKDMQGRYLGCNQAFESMFQVARGALVGKTAYDISPAELAAQYAENDRQLLEAPLGEKQQYEAKVKTATGLERDVIFYKACFGNEKRETDGIIGALLDITERKLIEEQLRTKEQQMSDIIEFLPDATWVIDQNGCVIAWNKACEELTGVSARDMIGQGDHAYAIPFYGRRRPLLIDGALQEGSLSAQNYSLLEQKTDVITGEVFADCVHSGKGAYLWGIARRLFDDRGRVVGAIESVRDVTERKHTEVREHARADILEHIAKDASLEDVLTTIVRDIEQEHTELLCSILLVDKTGTRLTNGVAPSLPDFYNTVVNGLKIKEGAGSCGTAAFLRKRVVVADIENHPYWHNFWPARDLGLKSCWSEPILSSTGELYGTFALYSRSVWEPGPEEIRLIMTAANYASIAIERMKSVTALRESERKYRELVENANSIILRIDLTGRITFFNEYAQQFFGYKESEILGQHLIGTIIPAYESTGRNLAEMVADLCTNPEKYTLNEHENVRKNGELVFISWANKASRASDGGLEEILCIGQDITERKRMQEIMVQTEKMMTVGGLAAGMAHELNNPISTITQDAQNILRRISDALPANTAVAAEVGVELPRLRDYLERRKIPEMLEAINSSCERAAMIITNMLTFSRKSTTRFELASLDVLVDKAIQLAACEYDLKKQYDFKNIRIVREFDETLPPLNVVPLEIEQVLLNLLKNAAQALSGCPSDIQPEIIIRLKYDDQYEIIEVEDNGPGIDPEQRSRVFEPFFTTKQVGEGTGLGLSISYSIIVNKHLGLITVDSQPGKGACFTIKLPRESNQCI